MTKRENTPNEKTTVYASLLDEIVAEGRISGRSLEMRITTEATPDSDLLAVTFVEFQLIEWTMIEIPCPGCGHYPCKPGHMNGHRLITNIAKPGRVIRVAM